MWWAKKNKDINVKKFCSFNNLHPDAARKEYGDGIYIDPDEVVAVEGTQTCGGYLTVLHLRNGSQFTVIGAAYNILGQLGHQVKKAKK